MVRDFKTADAADSGKINLTIPGDLRKKDVKVIAYIQEKESKKITGAAAFAL